jgi:sugar diacid utilization regulator
MTLKMKTETNKLMRLFEINKLLTKSMKLEHVLETFVSSAMDLIKFADAVFLFLYDEEKNLLQFVEGVGVDKETMRHMAISPGESITGSSFLTKTSMLFTRNIDIEKGMVTMSEKNSYFFFKSVNDRKPESSFCVPLVYQDQCLGVINVDSFKRDIKFVEEDMKILEIIADQCAISIMNSRHIRLVESQNYILNKSIDIHKKFTKLVLENKDKDQILAMLSDLLQCMVMYKDTEKTEVGYQSFKILTGNEELGYIHYNRNDLSPLDTVAIEHGATALALNIVRDNALFEKEINLRKEFFQNIISDISLVELRKLATQFKWEVNWNFVCIVMEGKHKSLWDGDKVTEKKRLIKYVENQSKSICAQSFIIAKGLQIIVITPVFNENTVQRIITRITEGWKENSTVIIGIGRQTTLDHIVNSFNEAKDAINYGKNKDIKNHIIHYKQLGVERLYQKVDLETLDNFVKDFLGPLFKIDDVYKETLFKLIELNKNHKETSIALHIHFNTLYKRLKKIEETLDISFENISDWHNIKSAYHIYKQNF